VSVFKTSLLQPRDVLSGTKTKENCHGGGAVREEYIPVAKCPTLTFLPRVLNSDERSLFTVSSECLNF